MTTEIDRKRLLIEGDELKRFSSILKKPKQIQKSKILQQEILDDFNSMNEWRFTPMLIKQENDTVFIRFQIKDENDKRLVFFESLKESYTFFQNTKEMSLPSLVDLTTLIHSSDSEITISLHQNQFRSIQILNYTRYLASFVEENTDVKNKTHHMPQYPYLLKMYNSRGDPLEVQKLICFLKVVREWVFFNVKKHLNRPESFRDVTSRLKEETQDQQLNVIKHLHEFVNVVFCYFRGNVDIFNDFFKPESIGLTLVFHFLFMNSVDKIHYKFVEELGEFFRIFDAGKEREIDHPLRARHLSLVADIHMLRNAQLDENGYFDLDIECQRQKMNPNRMKTQIYALICDPDMSSSTALSMLCYMTSSLMKEYQNRQMRNFAAMVQTPYKQKQEFVSFKNISVSVQTDPSLILDNESIKRVCDVIFTSEQEKKSSSSKILENDIPSQDKKTTIDPISYLKMIKQAPLEPNILTSDSSRIELSYMSALFNFVRELEKNTIINLKHFPQFFSYEEYDNPSLQLPLRLTSTKSCVYLNNVYLSKY